MALLGFLLAVSSKCAKMFRDVDEPNSVLRWTGNIVEGMISGLRNRDRIVVDINRLWGASQARRTIGFAALRVLFGMAANA